MIKVIVIINEMIVWNNYIWLYIIVTDMILFKYNVIQREIMWLVIHKKWQCAYSDYPWNIFIGHQAKNFRNTKSVLQKIRGVTTTTKEKGKIYILKMVNFQRMRDELDSIEYKLPVIGKAGCLTLVVVSLFILFIIGFGIGFGVNHNGKY